MPKLSYMDREDIKQRGWLERIWFVYFLYIQFVVMRHWGVALMILGAVTFTVLLIGAILLGIAEQALVYKV